MAGCATFHIGQFQYTHNNLYQGKSKDIPIWVDNNFGESDRIAIDDAISKWNYSLNGYIHLYVIDDHFNMEISEIEKQRELHGWLLLKINSKGDVRSPQSDTLAFADKVGGDRVYIVRDHLSNDQIFGVTMHEIGHLLGSEHNKNGLMYSHYSKIGFQCIDYNTVKNVADYWGIFIGNLNYCYDKKM